MCANYKLVRNPNPKRTNELQPLHPRLVSSGTIDTKEFIKRAKNRSSFSSGDIKGVLQLFQDMIAEHLMYGYNVELEGIGTFSVSLQCRPVMDKKEIRSESVQFRDVKFRSSKELRERLCTMPVFRSENVESDKKYFSPEECERRLMAYLDNHPSITRTEYMSLCRCKKTKAATDLKRFTEEGKLDFKVIPPVRLYYKTGTTSPATL